MRLLRRIRLQEIFICVRVYEKKRGNVKKRSKHKSLLAVTQDEQDIGDPISKVQQQLTAIEKKLDILINQSSKKPFEKSYSQRPPRRFDRPQRYERGGRDDGPRERTFTKAVCADCNKECEIPFKPSGDRPVYCKDCFAGRKKENLFNSGPNKRSEGRDFSRDRYSGKRQRVDKKKKPFFARRKRRG